MLKSRLYKPTNTSDIIYRSRLLDLLNRNTEKPLVLISAPAGYGKSTLISQWLETQNKPYSWLTLDKSLNNLTVFLQYFIEVLSELQPAIKKRLERILNSASVLTPEAIASDICNAFEDPKKQGIVVLDDYYHIVNPSIHNIINYLINHCPLGQKILILSRFDPPFKLKRHRLYGKLLDIRIKDLAFDRQEFQQLVKIDFEKQDKTLSTIYDRSEGWILGITMLLKIKNLTGSIEECYAAEDLIVDMDFLLGEYLPKLPNEFLQQLMLASICHRFNEQIIEGLFRQEFDRAVDAKTFLSKLKEFNLFLVSEGQEQKWFRFHKFFRELLSKQFQNLDKEAYERGMLFLSRWFASKGSVEIAIDYAVRVKNWEMAEILINKNRVKAFNRGQWWRVKEWLDQLPMKMIRSKPSLLIAHIWVLENYWDHDNISSALVLLRKLLSKEGSKSEFSEYYFHLSHHLLISGAPAKDVLENALYSKALYNDQQMLGGRREMVIAFARHMQGETDDVLKTLDDTEKLFEPEEIMFLRTLCTRVFVLLLAGRFEEANEYNSHFSFVTKNNYKYMEAWSAYLSANLMFQRLQAKSPLEKIESVLEYEGIMDWRALMDCYSCVSLHHLLLGDESSARIILSNMKAKLEQFNNTVLAPAYDSLEMRFLWLLGEGEKALFWAREKRELSINGFDPLFSVEVPDLTRIRILITFGNEKQLITGKQMLASFEALMRSVNNDYYRIDICLLNALAHWRLKEWERSQDFVIQSFELYRSQRINRPFAEFQMAAPQLFEQVDDLPLELHGIFSKVAHKHQTPTPNTRPSENVNHLGEITKRELQIVKLTASGLRNKEIADQLNISTATVKSHLTHIYQKLNVRNRTSMIRRVSKHLN